MNYLYSGISAFRWLVKQGGFRPDIIHAHVFTSGILALILGRLFRIPVAISEHYSGILRGEMNRREKIEFKLGMSKADIALPVSKSLKKAMIADYGIRNKIQVIP